MIQLIKESIGEIPILHVVRDDLHNQALPTVVYYHGYNGEKISSLTLAYKIAEQGYRVVLPDSMFHGERKQGKTQTELDLAFWDIVMQNIVELDIIKQHLLDTGHTLENRIGIGGTSMGAITTYGALRKYPWIKTGAALMGTAFMTDYAKALIQHFNETQEEKIPQEQIDTVVRQIQPFDLSIAPDTLQERPLLIWHGEEDQVVPYAYSPAIYEKLKPLYTQNNHLHFVSEAGRSHHISRLSMSEATAWFRKYV